MIRQRAADKMSSCDRREESKTISCLTGNKRRDQVLCSFLVFLGFFNGEGGAAGLGSAHFNRKYI